MAWHGLCCDTERQGKACDIEQAAEASGHGAGERHGLEAPRHGGLGGSEVGGDRVGERRVIEKAV